MNADVQWLDEYCNAKLASQSYGKLLGPLIKEYKINLDRYITSVLALVDTEDGYANQPINLPDTYAANLLEAGMPFYYLTVVSALSKVAGDRLEINTIISSSDNHVLLMRSNINGKYLCAFVNELDDDIDNNNFFVWSDGIDTTEFVSLNKSTVHGMCKQTTLRSGIDLLLA